MTKAMFGIHLPSSSTTSFRDLVSYAIRCEDLGFDSVWVADHILSGVSSGPYEPLTTLAALSGLTERVHLGTSVLIASLRNPILLADITATIQEASGGRLILGIGTGWDQHEFKSMGIPFKERGVVTNECLEIIRGLWKGEAFSFDGTHFSLKDIRIGTPSRQPIPIWIGGNSHMAIRRAAKHDAWFPTDPTKEEISRGRLELTRLTKIDRKPMIAAHIYLITEEVTAKAELSAKFLSEKTSETLDSIRQWAIVGDAETAKEIIGSYIDTGVQYFAFSVPYTRDYEASLDRVGRLVGEF